MSVKEKLRRMAEIRKANEKRAQEWAKRQEAQKRRKD